MFSKLAPSSIKTMF
ncbi:hypothetical protein ACNIU4_08675 [Escherichia coli]